MTIDLGFDVSEIGDLDMYTAYVAIWSAQRGGFSPPVVAGSYGVGLAGGGTVSKLWGAGLSTYDEALRAYGASAALAMIPENAVLTVRTMGLDAHLALPDGHAVRAARNAGLKADNKTPFDAMDAFAPLVVATEQGRLKVNRLAKRQNSQGLARATEIAIEAMPFAKAYSVLATQSERNEIFATQADPDPHNLMRWHI